MEDIQYIGEHLWIGQIGHFLVLLAFVAALFSAFSFFKDFRSAEPKWSSLAKGSYWLHSISVWGVIGLILYAMLHHMYEYDYVYRTVSDTSALEYLLAAFWADQEGSFLLWMFWHCVLGLILMYRKPKWSAGAMVTLGLIQAFLTAMLLGIYLPTGDEDFKFGSNPFILVRDVYQAPIFANADYLTLIEGRGLNPLLQNYWMTIHPPVLFLGFASLSIPFSMVMSGLSMSFDKGMLTPLLKWSLFSASIFGLGILMGGAWAYEALTFGGYWAWDPVENTSLVPWLILLAGIHTNLIAKATSYSIKTTYAYYLLAFIMVVYSTFLTRSGILGDTSVHAFTTMGLETQLALFIVFFAGLAIVKYFIGGKGIPVRPTEEAIYSREFWMFVGALVLFFSGFLMTASTSLPVFNKLAELWDPNHIPVAIDDPMEHHNKYQIWIGIFMGTLTGVAVYLRYQGANWNTYKLKLAKRLGISVGISILLTWTIGTVLNTFTWQHHLFLFAGLFTFVSNLDYLFFIIKRNTKMTGAALSHMGFGVLILGIMFSGLNKKTLTGSAFTQGDFTTGNAVDKATVLIKNLPFYQGDYLMNYTGDTLVGNLRKYELEFKKLDKDKKVIDAFTTYPSALYNQEFSKIAALNPGNERKLLYDVFTASAPNEHMQDIEIAKAMEDSLKYLSYLITPGEIINDSFWVASIGEPIYNYEIPEKDLRHADTSGYDLTFGIPLSVKSARTGRVHDVIAGLGLRDAFVFQYPAVIDELGIKIKLAEEVFSNVFTEEDALTYEDVTLSIGSDVDWNGYKVSLTSFDREVNHVNYSKEEGDLAVGANLSITSPSGDITILNPIYILRNSQQFSIKDYDAASGIHSRFTQIDPRTEQMTFRLAIDNREETNYELLIASGVPRSDILIVEANIFPGINLVWLGCLMMLGGLFMSLWVKMGKAKAST